MPRGDRTGPAGMGPMTGRAAGICAGYPTPGYTNPAPARGYGFGFGRGMGYGFRGGRGGCGGRRGSPYAGYGFGVPFTAPYSARPTREQELDALQGQAKYFEEVLGEIKKRINNLEAGQTAA